MTHDYADNKVSEALRLANGNPAKARRQIQAWFYEDVNLLLELTRPHWNGIVAYAVDRAVSRALRGDERRTEKPQKKPKKDATIESAIGKEMLRSFVSEKATKFGHEASDGNPPPRRAASQTHVDAIHLMAAKSRQNSKGQK